MNGIIRVSSDTLMTASADFQTQAGNVTVLIERMREITTSLTTNWEGEAAYGYLTKLRCLDEDIERMNTMILEYGTELEEIAAQYQLVDNQNIEEILALPDYVID